MQTAEKADTQASGRAADADVAHGAARYAAVPPLQRAIHIADDGAAAHSHKPRRLVEVDLSHTPYPNTVTAAMTPQACVCVRVHVHMYILQVSPGSGPLS